MGKKDIIEILRNMQKKNPFTSGYYPKNSQRVKSLIFYITLKSDHIREIVTCFLAMGIKEPEQDENKNNTGIALNGRNRKKLFSLDAVCQKHYRTGIPVPGSESGFGAGQKDHHYHHTEISLYSGRYQ